MNEKLNKNNDPQPEQKIEKEKPDFLYHASPNRDIKKFKPRAEKVRDENEGQIVFGTPDKAYASCFLVPTDDSWCSISIFGNNHVMVISDENRFKKLDKGGAIYLLPSETFETDPNKSMADTEWTSKDSVEPVDKMDYDSGLQAMAENGVNIYFVNKEIFEKIKESDDYGEKILKILRRENE